MNIKTHGEWALYTPATLPAGAPANALFAQRTSDGVDWYDYVNSGKNFAPDTIKMTIVDRAVGAATYDPTRLFPGNTTVLEVGNVVVDDPQAAFGRKIYDPANQTFHDPPQPVFNDPVAELLKRIEALEGKT